MRTALLAWDYPPAPSGLSTAAREIAESLAEAGAETSVFTLDRIGRETVAGVTVIGLGLAPGGYLARLRLWGAAGHLAAPLAFRRAVLDAHARAPFDVIEATNWYAPAALLADRRGCPPLVTRNSTPAAFTRDRARSVRARLDAWAADALERRQVRGSAGLISNTADHGATVARIYGLADRCPHAAIGLSLSNETLARARGAPYPEGCPVRLLFVGRAEVRKGFDILLAAVASLAVEADRGDLTDFTLALVGVPPEELPGDLPMAARRRIRALGRIDAPALAQAYEGAQIVVAPSRYESFGLVYQEAMAYGRPVAACAVDASARTFVGASGAGPLAHEASGSSLADALRPLIADPALRHDCRNRALAAAGRFDRTQLGRETLALYRQAIAART